MWSRGPDDEGLHIAPPLALGQRRLSIIDLSPAGHQPMLSADGRFALVFNGEFYNYRTHRTQLSASGVAFKGDSDTEVLLHLLIREGMSALEKVNGFFAFAFCDLHTHKIWLARDRFGIKPLYLLKGENSVAFASEMKALLPLMDQKEVNPTAIRAYLRLNYIPHPLSIFKGVEKLSPGRFVEITANQGIQVQEHSYYTLPPFHPLKTDYRGACKQLEELMEQSVARRMVADVPIGAFLSGGRTHPASQHLFYWFCRPPLLR
jgi:asparagine synthase (glutamine-hydrolysing)